MKPAGFTRSFPQTLTLILTGGMAWLAIVGWTQAINEVRCLAEEPPSAIPWVSDLPTAQRQAAGSGKLILLHFWSTTCPPCRFMNERVFPNRQVIQIISQNFVPVKVNVEQNPQMARQFGVSAVPSCFILTPSGEVLQKWVGASEPTRYAQQLSEVQAKWSTLLAQRQQAGPRTVAGGNPPPAASPPSSAPMTGGVISPPQVGTPGNLGCPIGGTPHAGSPSSQQGTAPPVGQPSFLNPGPSTGSQLAGLGGPGPGSSGTLGAALNPRTEGNNPQPVHLSASSNPASGILEGSGSFPPTASVSPAASSGLPNNPQGGHVPIHLFGGTDPGAPRGNSRQTGSQDLGTANFRTSPGSQVSPTLTGASSPQTGTGEVVPSPGFDSPGSPRGPSPSPPGAPSPTAAQSGATWDRPPIGGNSIPHVRSGDLRTYDNPSVGPSEANHPPLGLDGFCPVQLTDFGKWVPGIPQWGMIHEGRTYLFAGPAERAKFAANPDRYAPVLSGYDVVLAAERGVLVPGKREFGGWYRGRVYLFANEQTLRQFDQDPNRYLSKLSQLETSSGRFSGRPTNFSPGGFLTPSETPNPETPPAGPSPIQGSPSVGLHGYPLDRR
jgi:YHS domain-containing protein/thiol-disulfide isomerase/thioredoxin